MLCEYVCVYFCIDDVVFLLLVDILNQQVFFYFQSFYAAVLNNTINLRQTVSFLKKSELSHSVTRAESLKRPALENRHKSGRGPTASQLPWRL
jgi:hypothetical protein